MLPNRTPPTPRTTGQDPFWAAMRAQDLKSLNLLALFHRIAAVFFVIVAVCGVPAFAIFSHLGRMNATEQEVSPIAGQYFGIFSGAAFAIIVIHLAGALLFWLAGGWLKSRRFYNALIAIELLTLLVVPHGTALGVFGMIVLLKPHVRATFP